MYAPLLASLSLLFLKPGASQGSVDRWMDEGRGGGEEEEEEGEMRKVLSIMTQTDLQLESGAVVGGVGGVDM